MAWFIQRETAILLLTLYILLEEVPRKINYQLWEVLVSSVKLRLVLNCPLFLSRIRQKKPS